MSQLRKSNRAANKEVILRKGRIKRGIPDRPGIGYHSCEATVSRKTKKERHPYKYCRMCGRAVKSVPDKTEVSEDE